MLARLVLEHLTRRREQGAVGQPGLDRLVGACERDVGAGQVGALAGDRRVDVQRRVEQDRALDPIGVPGCELRDELAAEAVAQPRRGGDAERVRGLDEIGDVLLDAPRPNDRGRDSRRRSRDRPTGAPRRACESAGRAP
jgi:hypothetical protein